MQQIYQNLKTDIVKIIADYESKIIELLYSFLNKENLKQKTKDEELQSLIDSVQNLINECLEKIYALIAKFVRENYPDIEFNEENIKSLTWNEDGISLEERITKLITTHILKFLNEEQDILKTKRELTYQIIRILDTEAFVVSNRILENKLRKGSKYFQILTDKCCERCGVTGEQGIQPIHKLIDIPPFHPNCQCIIIYYTDIEKNI